MTNPSRSLLACFVAALVATAALSETSTPWQIIADNFRGVRAGEEVGNLVNVEIRHDSLTAFGDRGRWDHRAAIATLIGNVRILSGASVVTCDSATYYRDRDYARLEGHVHAVDGPFIGEADTAHVYRREERVTLLGRARVIDSEGDIRADRIDYDDRSGVAVARGNVTAFDVEGRTRVTGDRMVYNAAGDLATITGSPHLQSESDTAATMHVWAEEMRLERTAGIAEAHRNVRIRQGTIQATGDLAVMNDVEDWIRLTGNPRAWDVDGDIQADTLLVWVRDDRVERLDAIGHSRVRQEPVTGARRGEQIRAYGDRTVAYFSNGRIDSLVVSGNASSDYMPPKEEIDAGSGVNHARAQTIHLYLEGGEVGRIVLKGAATGRYWFAATANGPAAPADTTVAAPDSLPPTEPDEPVDEEGGGAEGASTLGAPAPFLAALDPPLSLASSDTADVDTTGVDTADVLPDTLRVLTLSRVLAPLAPDSTSAAPADSAAQDSLAWAARTGDLSAMAPPDSLFETGRDEVTYGGEVVEFFVADQRLVLREEASVQYGEAWLRAGDVVYDVAAQSIEASNGPTLSDPGGELRGYRMDYDVASREGVAHRGRTEFDGGYYFGRRIKKVDENVLVGESCTYTTCDQLDPHFHFLAPKMRMSLGKNVVARPVVLHVADVPLLAVPFFVFPTQRGRRSGFLFPEMEVGISDARGRFARNLGYYWAINDYLDAQAWLDVFEKSPRWIGYAQTRYRKRYVLDGGVYASYAWELPERQPTFGEGPSSRRWEFRAQHNHNLSPSSKLTVDANFVSDKQFLLDQGIGENVEQQVDRLLRSNLAFSKTWSGASLTLRASRTQDLDADSGAVEVTSTLPSATFSLNRRNVGRRAVGRDPGFLPFLSSMTYGYSVTADQPVIQIKDGETTRDFAARQDISVSDSRALLGVLNVSPNFRYSTYLFEEDNRGERWQTAARWSAGASLNTTLYGTFTPPVGLPLAIRHVMSPSIGFTYVPRVTSGSYVDEQGVRRPRFPSVGSVSFGDAARSRTLSISVANRFQAKVGEGENVKRIDELANLSLSTGYNFENEDRPWSPLSSSFRTRPHRAFNVDLSMSHDVYAWTLRSLSINTNLSLSGVTAGALPAGAEFSLAEDIGGQKTGLLGENERATAGQPWSLSVGHTYSRGADGDNYQSTLRGQLGLSLTKKWQITYSANANIREGDITSQSFSVVRDLHCWQARFERRLFGGSASYYFRIGVKDIQEIFYEQRN